MHAHSVLMLAAAGVVWLFVAVVVAANLLQRRGRIATDGGRRTVRDYGPILAAACSGGAAVIHVAVVSSHAAQSVATVATTAGGAPIAFLCSIGAGGAHFSSVAGSAAAGTFLPLGILSIGLVPLQGAWALPAMWRRASVARAGLLVALSALVLAVVQQLLAPAATVQVAGATTTGSDVSAGIALFFELALLSMAALLVWGRPRRLVARLEVTSLDAWILTAVAVGAIAIFGATALLTNHAGH